VWKKPSVGTFSVSVIGEQKARLLAGTLQFYDSIKPDAKWFLRHFSAFLLAYADERSLEDIFIRFI
jgi:hypothetical protein